MLPDNFWCFDMVIHNIVVVIPETKSFPCSVPCTRRLKKDENFTNSLPLPHTHVRKYSHADTFACMPVLTHTHTHTQTSIHTYTHTHINTHTHTHTLTRTDTQAQTHTHTHTDTHTHTETHTYTHTHTHTHTHTQDTRKS